MWGKRALAPSGRIWRQAARTSSRSDLNALMEAVSRATTASQSLLLGFDEAGAVVPMAGTLVAQADRYRAGGYAVDDPVLRAMRQGRSVMVVHASEPSGPAAGRAVTEFYAPLRMRHHLGLWLAGPRVGAAGMKGVYLARADEPFSRDQVAWLRRVAPALRAAVERSEVNEQVRLREQGLAALCEAHLGRFAVFTRDGALVAASAAAEPLLAAPRQRAELSERVRRFTRGVSPGCPEGWTEPFAWNGVRLQLFLVGAEPGWVGVRESTARADPAEALSPAERRVYAELCRGASNKEIASALGISPDTVRTHLKQILGKLRVASRLQAARLKWVSAHEAAPRHAG